MESIYRATTPYSAIVNTTLLFLAVLWLSFFSLPVEQAEAAESSGATTITLAFSTEGMAPYYSISEDGKRLQGMWQQMLEALFAKKLGWQVKYLLRPWQRAQNEVKLGNADAFISIITPERKQYATAISTPFFCFPLHLFTYKNHPRMKELLAIRTLEDIAAMQLTLASNIGNGWQKTNIEQRGIRTHWLNTDEQVIQFVAMGRSDGAIDLPSSYNKLINELNLHEKIVDTGITFGPVYVHLMLGKNSPLIEQVDLIDQAMRQLSEDGTFAEICQLTPGHMNSEIDKNCSPGHKKSNHQSTR